MKAEAGLILTLRSRSPGQTRRIGTRLGEALKGGAILALDGDLGSGKTVFVQGLSLGLGVFKPKEIRSPTFAIIQEHAARIPLCHVDLYRLSEPAIRNLGLEEYWTETSGRRAEWVVAIEWAGRAGSFVPGARAKNGALRIRFKSEGKTGRTLEFFGGPQWKKKLSRIKF